MKKLLLVIFCVVSMFLWNSYASNVSSEDVINMLESIKSYQDDLVAKYKNWELEKDKLVSWVENFINSYWEVFDTPIPSELMEELKVVTENLKNISKSWVLPSIDSTSSSSNVNISSSYKKQIDLLLKKKFTSISKKSLNNQTNSLSKLYKNIQKNINNLNKLSYSKKSNFIIWVLTYINMKVQSRLDELNWEIDYKKLVAEIF